MEPRGGRLLPGSILKLLLRETLNKFYMVIAVPEDARGNVREMVPKNRIALLTELIGLLYKTQLNWLNDVD